MQIGDFAKKAGLSVRTVRYYEELELLAPDSHSEGGFRLYGNENLRRIRVINILKELGLSLTEIRQILLAKKASGGHRPAVQLLLGIFGEKLKLVDMKISALNRVRGELSRAMEILRSCESCNNKILLDALSCAGCSSLNPRESVPETFQVILQ